MNMIRLAVLSLLGFPVNAQPVPDNLIQAEIMGGWRTESGTHMAAVRLTMAPGWHTYWRSPGEAGIPPVFDWSGSSNLAGVSYHWPIPQIFSLNGLRTLGYEDELILPVEFAPLRAGERISIAAAIDLGVCDEICVPVSVVVAADLPEGTDPDPAIGHALAAQPEPGRRAGLDAATCSAEPIRDGLRLTAQLTIPPTGLEEFGVIEIGDSGVWVSPATHSRVGQDLILVADLVPPDARPFVLDRSDVRITLFGGGRAVDIRGCTG